MTFCIKMTKARTQRCLCVCVFMYLCVYVPVYTCVYVGMFVYMCLSLYMCLSVYMYVSLHLFLCVSVCVFSHTALQFVLTSEYSV